MKSLLKKIIPKFLILKYHKFLSFVAALVYNFPSREMIVIGVTGTEGKTTVVNLIAKILEEAGQSVGLASTINFKIKDKEWINDRKMTMLGRFALQRLLRQMVEAGCRYAVIETSSEGIAQYRHSHIDYDTVIFTNLTPEHIESHGSFENYKKVKGKLFEKLLKSERKDFKDKKTSIINLDDENANYFLQFGADEKIGYGIHPVKSPQSGEFAEGELFNRVKSKINENLKIVGADKISLTKEGSSFFVNGVAFNLKLSGEFNIYNALAAISLGISENINLEVIKNALERVIGISGRMEQIDDGQPFKIIIDYAHTPDSLEKVYQTINGSGLKSENSKIISVLGSCGGGRDKAKRPILGELAAHYADYVIITNEDPYDEDPQEIISQMVEGVIKDPRMKEDINFWQVLDREEAIKKALFLAKNDDIVLITGKGCEQCIMGPLGKKIPWDDREITKKIVKNLKLD